MKTRNKHGIATIDNRFKLNEREVTQIRQKYAQGGVTQDQLADRYGVSQHHISQIVRGETRNGRIAS